MKKIILLIIILLSDYNNIIYVDNQEIINDNTIIFIKYNYSTSLLIYTNSLYNLIELENKDKIYTTSINKYILDNIIVLDDLKIEKSDKSKGGQEGHKKHKLEKFKEDEITDTYIHELNKQL